MLAPDADTSNPFSEFLNQELSKSDRPELTSADVVISGGETLELTFSKQFLKKTQLTISRRR